MDQNRFSSLTEIRDAPGLRLACLRGVPTPWTEAAKGIFHVKQLPVRYGAQSQEDPEQALVS